MAERILWSNAAMVGEKKSDVLTKVLVIVGALLVAIIAYYIWHWFNTTDFDSFNFRDAGS
ncbi:MAG: hypothetical protein QM831_06850 [Kofleriaceae bacterium]